MAIFTAAAALGASILGTTAATTFGAAFIGQALIGFAAQAALGLALNALTPKPKLSGLSSGQGTNRGYSVTQKGAALDHQILYGRARVGGVIVHQTTSGTDQKYLHQVIAFTGHEIESFDEIYINDAEILNYNSTLYEYTWEVTTDFTLQPDTKTLTSKSSGKGRSSSEYSKGQTFTQDSSPSVESVANDLGVQLYPVPPAGSRSDTLKITGKMPLSNTVKNVRLPNGSVSSRYSTSMVITERLGTEDQTAVSIPNSWGSSHRLKGISYLYVRMRFDPDVFPNGPPQITATIKGKKVYDPRTDTTAWSSNPALCLRDYLSSGYGLSEEDSNIDDDLVSTAADVCDQTNTNNGGKRYTCNGAFTTDATPYDTLSNLLTSMGGLVWYSQGKWRMKPAYWVPPTITFTEDDLRGDIQVKTRHSRRDNFNTVRGTFRGEESDWQVTDYPEVTNESFLTADGGQESVADIELPFTGNSVEARRIARIALERNRQQITVSSSFGLRAFKVQVGDVVNLSLERFGWSSKTFEVVSWTFGLVDGLDLQVQMTLREISENVFDEVDDGAVYERDNTDLLSPFEAPEVGLSLSSSIEITYEHARNVITTTVSSASEIISQVEVQFKPTDDFNWIPVGIGGVGQYRITDLLDGDYDVRARSINTFGVRGEWKTRLGFSARGLATPPEQVQNLSAGVNGAVINLEWGAVSDLDLSYYRVRFTPELTGALWSWGIDYVDKVGKPATSVSVPARSGTYMIKAVDQGGRESTDFTSVVVQPANLEQFPNTITQTEDPSFTGTKTDCVVKDSSLRILNTTLWDDLVGNVDGFSGDWDFLGTGQITQDEGVYEFSDYIDIGSLKKARVRVDAYQQRFDTKASLFDNISGNLDNTPSLWDELTGNPDLGDTTVVTYVSTTEDDPAGTPTWTAYKRLRVADISARAFRFKVVLKAKETGITPSITGLEAVVQYN